jgi:ABC-2 type transport system ATP-binding protein
VTPVVSARGLSRVFRTVRRRPGFLGGLADWFVPRRELVTAVSDVTFEIRPGEMVGYIGPNGAGKSTTIKMLTGILVPTSGELVCAGHVPWKERRQYVRKIGVVFGQRTGLWWDLPAADSFRLLASVYRVPKPELERRMAQFDELLGIGRLLETPVRKLSLGERMRCDLAAALLHSPDLLFLDEPTIGLDVVAKAAIRKFLAAANRELGITLLLTTHDLDDIAELCPRVLLIDRGKLLYDGSLERLRTGVRPEVTVVFDVVEPIAEPPTSVLAGRLAVERRGDTRFAVVFDRVRDTSADVIRALIQDFPVKDLSIEEPTIEDVVRTIYEKGLPSGT